MDAIEPKKDAIEPKKRGRRRVYTDEERKRAITRSKTKYMLNKPWYCDICGNGHNYSLAGKHCHLSTKKHSRNLMELA